MDVKTVMSHMCGWAGLVFSTMITQEALNITLSVLSIVSIILSFVLTFIKWFKEARKDGHVSADEIEDLSNQLKDKVDETGGKDV